MSRQVLPARVSMRRPGRARTDWLVSNRFTVILPMSAAFASWSWVIPSSPLAALQCSGWKVTSSTMRKS